MSERNPRFKEDRAKGAGGDPRELRRAARGPCNSPGSLLLDSSTPPGGTRATRPPHLYIRANNQRQPARIKLVENLRRMRERAGVNVTRRVSDAAESNSGEASAWDSFRRFRPDEESDRALSIDSRAASNAPALTNAQLSILNFQDAAARASRGS